MPQVILIHEGVNIRGCGLLLLVLLLLPQLVFLVGQQEELVDTMFMRNDKKNSVSVHDIRKTMLLI